MTFESQFLTHTPCWLVASDEAGRGPLAGPVVASSVALRLDSRAALDAVISRLRLAGVNDSKRLTAQTRDALAKLVGPWTKATVEVDAAKIDEINILQASLLAMRTSAEALVANDKKLPVVWLIDGHRAPRDARKEWSIHPIVKGDAKSALIGLASIYAKVHRDHRMQEYHRTYPAYGFDRHAGYPTAKHRELIELHGPSPIHRKTFKGVREFLAR